MHISGIIPETIQDGRPPVAVSVPGIDDIKHVKVKLELPATVEEFTGGVIESVVRDTFFKHDPTEKICVRTDEGFKEMSQMGFTKDLLIPIIYTKGTWFL
eukprot:GHVU01155397.1.p8 GENE.GHVU01155397.1~~GHVU01155397.1.p8  ORF type:complete len:100 (+),score=17.37 GHVU01155397.1:5667-5966(+)